MRRLLVVLIVAACGAGALAGPAQAKVIHRMNTANTHKVTTNRIQEPSATIKKSGADIQKTSTNRIH